MHDRDFFTIVTKDVLLEHERSILKQILFSAGEAELMQGSLNQFPNKIPILPDYVVTKTLDEDKISYLMVTSDPLGERKISPCGYLLAGRQYLMNTFTLPQITDENARHDGKNLFVLVTDLIKSLRYDDGDEDQFLEKYNELLPLISTKEQTKFLLQSKLITSSSSSVKYITAKSAFVRFGAAVVVSGIRVQDDYWETLARDQGFTPYHRVFKLSKKLIDVLTRLKPSLLIENANSTSNELNSIKNTDNFESPYLTVTEQTSADVRRSYIEYFSQGLHIAALTPGQSIGGSLELHAHVKIPKYHSRHSFGQSAQFNTLDIPIGKHKEFIENAKTENNTTIPSTNDVVLHKRMLSSLLDDNSGRSIKQSEDKLLDSVNEPILRNSHLNIDGWKFESLPLKTDYAYDNPHKYSIKGLPLYDQDLLIDRLKKLTPHEIKELEHSHGAVFLNTSLQTARRIRSTKWFKYWQYKSGVPVGLHENQSLEFKDIYLKELLAQTSVKTVYNEQANMDEIQTTTRIPNANFLNNSNIKTFKPPFTNIPKRRKYK